MRKKEVILDFTSLLDVILIILFFFILYSSFNVKESEARVEKERIEYEKKVDALEAEKKQLNDERIRMQAREEELSEEWARVRTLDENAVQNQQALIAFNNGAMLSFNLQKEDSSNEWELRAVRKETATDDESIVGVIHSEDDLFSAITSVFDKAGFAEDEVLIVTFTYNGDVIGTNRLYMEIMKAFREVQAIRKNLYLNAINTSK